MWARPSKLYSKDGLSVKGFIFALSMPYYAHFSVALVRELQGLKAMN
ncbi:MAG: hypothetical protein HXX08_08190 [Chloroflexi bacterium]|uniref:Uncharacterized protein n=1 Tax=Candidatus Chlorohelix allophototropha TaxID=3003348 RepID=A0A8T7LZT4_9CHLR|nr:hypothetical protein [Chloroflexota bacterium]WJW67707.1 hypothetical protein OZ401_000982 [Chloroflexota bacterium L227-S17]